jgi:hypothetical protein
MNKITVKDLYLCTCFVCFSNVDSPSAAFVVWICTIVLLLHAWFKEEK